MGLIEVKEEVCNRITIPHGPATRKHEVNAEVLLNHHISGLQGITRLKELPRDDAAINPLFKSVSTVYATPDLSYPTF